LVGRKLAADSLLSAIRDEFAPIGLAVRKRTTPACPCVQAAICTTVDRAALGGYKAA